MTISRLHLVLATALFSIAAVPATFAQEPAMTGESNLGPILVDHNGMTLYTFDKDSAGKSACNGDCAKAWPPLMAAEGTTASGAYSIVTRDDGGKQWAYEGKPLYLWVKDTKPGDVTGDKFKDVWHVVQP